jgi:hypothetical protein
MEFVYKRAQTSGELASLEEVKAALSVERSVADERTCRDLVSRVKALEGLRLEVPDLTPEATDGLSLAIHPRVIEIRIEGTGLDLSIRDAGGETSFFNWAIETMEKLEPCWRPATAPAPAPN